MDSVFCCLPIRGRKNRTAQIGEASPEAKIVPTWENRYSDEEKTSYPDEKKCDLPYGTAKVFSGEKKGGFTYEEKADYKNKKQCGSTNADIQPTIKQEDSNEWNSRENFNANVTHGILDASIPYIPYSALDIENEDAIEPPPVEPPLYHAYEPQNDSPDFPQDAIRFALRDSWPFEPSTVDRFYVGERREAEGEQDQFFNSIRYGDQLNRGLNELGRFQEDYLHELGECSGLTVEELNRRRRLSCWEDEDKDDCMLDDGEFEWEEDDDNDDMI